MGKIRPELERFETNLDYLDGNGFVAERFINKLKQVKEGKVVGKGFISPKGRKLIGKMRNNNKSVRTWDTEYLEFMLYKICFALVKPFPPKKEDLAKELGISKLILFELINTPQYLEIKKSLRKELRAKWGAEVDQAVIRRAIRGSDPAAKLFYDLQGELIQKIEVTKKDAIPESPEDKEKLIQKLIKETNTDYKPVVKEKK